MFCPDGIAISLTKAREHVLALWSYALTKYQSFSALDIALGSVG
jgi:hypothetical protein